VMAQHFVKQFFFLSFAPPLAGPSKALELKL